VHGQGGQAAEAPGPAAAAPGAAPGQPQVIDLRGTELADQLRDALAARGIASGATAGGAAPDSGNMVEDRIAKLERLSKLRESGVLSEDEFQAEKARILGGS
jgi:hypothetical protein